jgi:hypothetical protein
LNQLGQSSDSNFDIPEHLQANARDNTVVKKKKEEVVDVLS